VASKAKRQLRAAFRAAVFARDNHVCRVCGAPAVDAHHITDRHELPGGGSVPENGIALCGPCHELAEQYHATFVAAPGYSPEELYAKVGSSYEAAWRASELSTLSRRRDKGGL
jgi:hypothetical protein